MSGMTLIRPHDPFSGHTEPVPDEDTTPPLAPVVEPTPVEPAVVEEKRPARKGRRPRRTPTAAEMEAARAKVARR
jgi:hypothetical protein